MTQAFPSPLEHPLPAVTTPGRQAASAAADLRPGRARCSPRSSRPPPTPTSAGSAWSACSPARCAPDVGRARLRARPVRRARARRPRRRRADRRADLAAGQAAAHRSPPCVAGDICAVAKLTQRRDRRHAVGQGAAAADGAVDHARAAAAGRDRRQVQGRRGQDVAGAGPAGRRGPDAAPGEQRRDRASSCCGAWARRTPTCCSTGCAAGTAWPWRPSELRVPLRETVAARPRAWAGNVKQSGGHGAVRRSATSRWSRCRRARASSSSTRSSAASVPRQFIPSVEKGVRAQMEQGVVGGLPDGRHPGDPVRRQGALGGLLRHGLPEGRRARAADAAAARPRCCCSSRSTSCRVLVADDYVGAVMSDLSVAARPGARHRAGRPAAARWSRPRSPSSS